MDIIVPLARVIDLVVCEDQVPLAMQGQLSGVVRGHGQAQEIGHAFGRSHKPRQPLMVYGPDNYMPILIIGDGETEAAELQDLAQDAIGRQEEMVRKTGRGFDFDSARERAGMVRREDFGRAASEAFERRAAFLRANQVTKGR